MATNQINWFIHSVKRETKRPSSIWAGGWILRQWNGSQDKKFFRRKKNIFDVQEKKEWMNGSAVSELKTKEENKIKTENKQHINRRYTPLDL